MSFPFQQLHSFLEAAQAAADPRRALRPHLDQLAHQLPDRFPLLAFGKASLEMADEALLAFGPRISRGIATCVPERLQSLPPERRSAFARFELLPADHPLATQRNLIAAARVRDFVSSIAPQEHLLVLISGGGSAHLTLPADGLSLDNLRDATRLLQRDGRDIRELNCVRKHCEQLKGGRLAALCPARDMRVLTLSDVLGDPLDVISSGPFAPDPTNFAQALHILQSSIGPDAVPEITAHLRRGERSEIPETPKPGDAIFQRVRTTVIASNQRVLDALATAARAEGRSPASVRPAVEGDAQHLAAELAASVRSMRPREALLVGGEWTVHAGESSGTGGPSQELALALAIALDGVPFHALVYSTDGIDGPTDAAGAIVHGHTCEVARRQGLDPAASLARHDSYSFFASLPRDGATLLRPGPTGTNLNHVAVIVRD